MAQTVKNPPVILETWVLTLGWEDPLEAGMATHSTILAWEIHGQRSLVGCSPCGHKESDTTEGLSTAHIACPQQLGSAFIDLLCRELYELRLSGIWRPLVMD